MANSNLLYLEHTYIHNSKEKSITTYRMVLSIPAELELSARENAYDMGFVRADKGILSNYIQLLALNDLKDKPSLKKTQSVDYGEMKRVNITIDASLKEDIISRAKQLGFIKAGKGNISSYLRYLLASSKS